MGKDPSPPAFRGTLSQRRERDKINVLLPLVGKGGAKRRMRACHVLP